MDPLRSPSAAIKTLGCKLNQFESQQIRAELCALGCRLVPFESPADLYIISSCTVTARTDRDCRRLIRHARKLNPDSFVAVTGCYAEVAPEALAAIPEADLVVGNRGKAELVALIRERLGEGFAWEAGGASALGLHYAGAALVEEFSDHTRAFVKVQEGCDAHCTYCIIPKARGASRSVPPEDVRQQVERLVAAGHPEIVLIGIHLGKYGEDLAGGPDLAGLVAGLCETPGLGRLRLSSIEPREGPERLVELVTQHPQVCRHLHIPLQSGSDGVLARMGRPYDVGFYANLVASIHAREPRTCLGADVMVGFPGETEEEFEETRRLLERLPLSYLHVFTYSPREGTPAAEMAGQVAHEVKLARNHVLHDLSEAKRAALAAAQVGEVLGVVLEREVAVIDRSYNGDGAGQLLMDGLSDNYLRVHVEAEEGLLGSIQRVRMVGAVEGVLRGELAGGGR